MKVKATKTMAKEIQKATRYSVRLVEMTREQFRALVDFDLICHTQDYDYEKGRFKVIEIEYPYEYYANPQYLTTRALNYIYKSGMDLEDYISAVVDYITI